MYFFLNPFMDSLAYMREQPGMALKGLDELPFQLTVLYSALGLW